MLKQLFIDGVPDEAELAKQRQSRLREIESGLTILMNAIKGLSESQETEHDFKHAVGGIVEAMDRIAITDEEILAVLEQASVSSGFGHDHDLIIDVLVRLFTNRLASRQDSMYVASMVAQCAQADPEELADGGFDIKGDDHDLGLAVNALFEERAQAAGR